MGANKLTPFLVMDIVKEAIKYDDCIHFEIGQPDIAPPPMVVESFKNINLNSFSYTPSNGLCELREKIAIHYQRQYNVTIDPQRILVTPGTSGAFSVAYSLLLGQNDILGLSDPSYPCYKNFAYLLGVQPKFFNVYKQNNYEFNITDLKKEKLNALLVSSPSNPTGAIYRKKSFKELIEYCNKNDIGFISDELYHGLSYGKTTHSALEFSDNVYVANGFSKFFCMPGLRVGWLIVPETKTREAEIIMQNLFISTTSVSQYAALHAFDYKYLQTTKEIFKERRDFLYHSLKDVFDICCEPDGAFYLWVDISKYNITSIEFAKKLLETKHVAVTPGVDFGTNNTHHYIRLAYTTDIEKMKIGIERIKSFLSSL
jgi:aspartate/methionine/tyrosine aminotransferase